MRLGLYSAASDKALYLPHPQAFVTFHRMGDTGQWKCRVCGFERWHVVTVKRKSGALYTTSFYACSGCSAMFLSPDQFNALGHAVPNVEMPRVVALPARRR